MVTVGRFPYNLMCRFGGPSRAFPGLVPGEVERRFGTACLVDRVEAPTRSRRIATHVRERTATDAGAQGESPRT